MRTGSSDDANVSVAGSGEGARYHRPGQVLREAVEETGYHGAAQTQEDDGFAAVFVRGADPEHCGHALAEREGGGCYAGLCGSSG